MSKLDIDEKVLDSLLDRLFSLAQENGSLRSELEFAKNASINEKQAKKEDARNQAIALVSVCLHKPDNKIEQIKALRQVTEMDLKTAKDSIQIAWERAGKLWNRIYKEENPNAAESANDDAHDNIRYDHYDDYDYDIHGKPLNVLKPLK